VALTRDQELSAQLRALEERLLDPEVRASPEQAGELLADEFLEFGSSGRCYNKAQVLQALAAEAGGDPHFSMSGFELRALASHIALATYRASARVSGEADARHSLRSSLWVLRAGRWQMVFHQGTPTSLETRLA
jgi:hypothetical protein